MTKLKEITIAIKKSYNYQTFELSETFEVNENDDINTFISDRHNELMDSVWSMIYADRVRSNKEEKKINPGQNEEPAPTTKETKVEGKPGKIDNENKDLTGFDISDDEIDDLLEE